MYILYLISDTMCVLLILICIEHLCQLEYFLNYRYFTHYYLTS